MSDEYTQVKFAGDRCWWTVQARDERYTILTRQANAIHALREVRP